MDEYDDNVHIREVINKETSLIRATLHIRIGRKYLIKQTRYISNPQPTQKETEINDLPACLNPRVEEKKPAGAPLTKSENQRA